MTKRELKFLLTDLEILSSKKITEEEAQAKDPETIYHINNKAYEWKESKLTHEDIVEALLAKQAQDVHFIRNVCLFFAFVLGILIFLGIINFAG